MAYRSYALEQKYGLSPQKVDKLLSDQKGACPLCSKAIYDKYVVDHNHETGEVRGLLCPSCNQALGKFQDDAAIIRAAIDYLS